MDRPIRGSEESYSRYAMGEAAYFDLDDPIIQDRLGSNE